MILFNIKIRFWNLKVRMANLVSDFQIKVDKNIIITKIKLAQAIVSYSYFLE
jgi:hypothetical protein